MARSSPDPPLRTPLGARFTVTRLLGHVSPEVMSAARTRSRDSRHGASGRPTMEKPGSPLETWTSTRTTRPVTPNRVAEMMVASMGRTPRRTGLRAELGRVEEGRAPAIERDPIVATGV